MRPWAGSHGISRSRSVSSTLMTTRVARPLGSARMQALRAQFPVLERVAYLNSGSDGPLPAAAVEAARAELADAERSGRVTAHFERRLALQGELREGYARLLGVPARELALTTSTTDGIARVIAGLGLGRDDEMVTSDQEHPGLVGPLLAARRRGVNVRAVPFGHVAEAVGPDTTLVAVSHVSWITGEVAPAALAELDVPVLLDGAQGAGAVHVDPRALGCAARTGPACSGSIRRSRRRSRRSAPDTPRSPTRPRGWRGASRTRPPATTRRCCRARAWRCRSRRCACSRTPDGPRCMRPAPPPRGGSPMPCASAAAR